MEKDILVIGTGNMSTVSKLQQEDVQIEDFQGARFQHFTDMLKLDTTIIKVPKVIIFNVAFFDRSSDPTKTSCRNFVTMMTWIKTRFPTIKICLTEINFSSLLPKTEQINLNKINKCIAQFEGAIIIPNLDEKSFKLSARDSTEWSEATANAMLCHWLNYLN